MKTTRKIALINQKGGVGKTTSSINIGAALAKQGKRVFLVDLDPQAHLTYGIGIKSHKLEHTIYDFMKGKKNLKQVSVEKFGMCIIPSSLDLSGAEIEFSSVPGREFLLKESLEKQKADKIAILEKERLKEEQKAAKARKAFAIAEILINTAVNISKVLYNPFLVGLVSTLGALQLAKVLTTPIPQYKDGLDNAKSDHIAMINDGGKKEYVERNGKILSTNTKNAIVNLKKNDTVHKDYESMQKNSKIYSIIANGEILKQNEFDKLANIMESSIIKGFSKAKVNASFKNINKSTNNYLKQKARFNG